MPQQESAGSVAPLGLHCLYDDTGSAEDGDLEVDIIAIHGLGANPEYAWYCKPDAANPVGVRWLQDQALLRDTLKNHSPRIFARTFCFNYTSAWFGSKLTKNRLEDLGRKLLDYIEHSILQGPRTTKRPLLFLCHSFGGIVLEQAIVQAASTSNALGSGLLEVICGIIFLGTPHAGSDMTRFGLMVANAAHILDHGQSELLADVAPSSWKVWDMVASFIQTINKIGLNNDNEVVCFFENTPTDYTARLPVLGRSLPKLFGGMVVTRESAVLQGFHGVLLESDHLKLNKFRASTDPGYTPITTNMMRILCNSPSLIERRCTGASSNLSSHFLVPNVRVKDFMSRDAELEQLATYFATPRIHGPHVLVLHAMGGQGKTQLAFEYYRNSRQQKIYRAVFWIQANYERLASRSFHDIAVKLGLVTPGDSLETKHLLNLVKQALEDYQGRWLLIFDNYDRPQQFANIKEYFPEATNGDILITSRVRTLDRLGSLMELQNLGVDECVRMLLRCYTSIETRAYLDEASRIVERLGCLPLAVDQAASYLAFRKHPIKEIGQFLELYEKQREIVLKHIPTESWEYSGIDEFDKPTALSAITTWEMSLQQLQGKPNTEVDSVIHLLSLCAFLAPITIPEFMFQWYWGGRFWWIDRWGADHNRAAWLHTDRERLVTEDTLRRWRAYNPNNMVLTHTQTLRAREMPWAKKVLTGIPEYLASSISQLVSYVKRQNKSVQGNQNLESGNAAFVWDTGHFWDIISLCDSLSLIRGLKREENSEGSFSLHPVIRDWLQLRLTWKETSEYIKEATALVATCADCYMSSGSPQSRKTLLSAHMDECLQQDNRLTMVVPIDEEGMEYDWTMRLISLFYYEQRRFEPAMKILRVALAPVRLAKLASIDPRRRWHGIAYQDVVRLVHNGLRFQLYAIYDDLGLHSDAQSLLSTIIESYSSSTILGEHPDSANMLMLQVAKVQQEGLTERTFEFAHRIVSMDHDASGLIGPMAFKGISLTDLAKTPEDVHRAATMLRDTMNVVNLEDDSAIDVNLSTTIKLAGLLSTQNRNEEAEKLVSAALTHYDKSERAGHPKVLELMRTAASISRVRGELDLSYSMYHALLQRQEIVYCPNTIDVLETKFQLGAILAQQHRYEQAEIYLRSTVSLQEETLGHDHPETLRTKSVLASVCYDTRQYASSEILWREVLAVESPPGRLGLLDRIDAAAGLRQLQLSIDVQACSLFNAEKYPEARAVWQRGLDITQKDENDDFEFMCIRQVGVCCTLLGLHTEAESYLSPCLERQKAVVGEDHGDTILMIALGDTLFHQGKYHQALDLFLKVEQLESKSTPGTPVLMETRVKCACSFRELKEYIKAENMVRAVLEMDESLFSADPHESQKHNAASLLIDVLVSRAADASSEKTYDIAETLCHEIVYIAKAYALEGISLMKYAQLILADSLFRQNRSDEAKSTLLELLKDPDEDDPPIPPMIGARLLLGEIYAGEAQWDTARHSFKEALSVLPNCHEENVPAMTAAARYWLGKTNHELGSQQEAGMLLLQQVLEYDDDVLTEAEIDRSEAVELLTMLQKGKVLD